MDHFEEFTARNDVSLLHLLHAAALGLDYILVVYSLPGSFPRRMVLVRVSDEHRTKIIRKERLLSTKHMPFTYMTMPLVKYAILLRIIRMLWDMHRHRRSTLMGFKPSPYNSIKTTLVVEEVVRGDRNSIINPYQWDHDYDPTLSWISKIRKDGLVAVTRLRSWTMNAFLDQREN